MGRADLAHSLFEEQACQVPDAPALIFGDRHLSYRELNHRANHFAHQLKIEPNTRVGICAKSSPESIVALLAVLKSGAAFVPLHPSDPESRLTQIIQSARLTLVISDVAHALMRAVSRLVSTPVVDLATTEPFANPNSSTTPDDPACILHTSGSTGHPKGVVRTHRGIVSRLAWTSVHQDDVFLHNMPLGTGFSEERLFLPLMRGRPLVMMEEVHFNDMSHLAATVEERSVTTLTLTPISLRRLLDLNPSTIQRLRNLRVLAIGGAELSADLIERFKAALPGTELINAYGSTESGSVIRGPATASSIGRPVANVKVLVLDPAMHPVVEGEIGELCISAPSLASEYLFQPELTAQRFIPDPLNPGSTERFYRTGDLVRCLPTGEISFHGRTDRQVKIRGFRVELREIETALEQHPQIQEAVTVARTQKPDPEPRLIAYFATKTKAPITIGHVRAHLQTLLPDYMIPSLFVPLPKLPRMQGGKVDMQSLPAPQATRPLLDAPYQPPRTPTEEAIAAIWENILGMTGIGVADNFLELGGDSLSAARVSVEIIERFDVEVPPDFLFDPGTVAAVAELVAP